MLSERIRTAIERASRLSPELQDKLAAEIEDAIDNALWDAELRDPRRRAIHRALIAEAVAEAGQPLPSAHDLGIEDDHETHERVTE